MRSSHLQIICSVALYFASSSWGLNIILNNDDGWASANIREFYKALKADGHNVWIVAPVENQSGRGGTLDFTRNAKLTSDGAFDSVPKGAPSFGTDPNDDHIWYYNGSPAACTLFALDYVVPNKWAKGTVVDLVVAGPNFGGNTGPYLYTLSGTLGATYNAIERGIPAVAFSAEGSEPRGYKDIEGKTKSGLPDPAIIIGQLSSNLVQQLARFANGKQLLPNGYGISVNLPPITSLQDGKCLSPQYTQTRMTGGAAVSKAVFDEQKGLFHSQNTVPERGANTCINGDCKLPGEATVIDKCQTAVTLFTIDYDAPIEKQEVVTGSRLVAPVVALANEALKTLNAGRKDSRNETSAAAAPSATITQAQHSGAEESLGSMNPFALLILAIGLVVLL